MRKNWIRRLALVLVLCLMVNNCIRYGSVRLFAAEDEQVISVSDGNGEVSADVSGGDVEKPVDVSDGDVTEQPEVGTAVMALNAVGAVQNDGSDSTVLEQPTVSTGDTLPLLQQNPLVMANTALFSAGTKQYINTYEDFLAVQSGCADNNGWEGTEFIISTPPTGDKIWNLADLEGFTGIGTAEAPFKGTLTCAYDSGVRLELDTPVFSYLGDGAAVTNLYIATESGSGAIAENISGSVTLSDITLEGTVGSDTSAQAGILAAAIADNSTITVSSVVTNGTIAVSGKVAGGIAGAVGDNVTVTLGEGVALSTTVTGTTAAGGHFGTVTGSASWNLAEESKLAAKVVANAAGCYAGQFAGKLQGELNITGNSVAVDVSGTGNGGGLIGLIGSGAKVVLSEALTITGKVNVTANAGGVAAEFNGAASGMEISGVTVAADVTGAQAGGVAGQISNSNCILNGINVTGSIKATDTAGGIVGGIGIGKYIISDVNIAAGAVAGSNISGGVIGKTTAAVAVELQGDITVGKVSDGWDGGLIAGTQGGSLIYFGEPDGSDDQLKVDSSDEAAYDELVRYGGIYRNQDINGSRFIGDGSLDNVGKVNRVITKNGDDYVLTCAADFEALSIALSTNGVYGAEAFGNLTDGYKTLLAASYLVQPADGNTIDISYEKTGIVTLDRIDKKAVEYGFSGIMRGANENVTIHQDTALRQQRQGVFCCIAGATIENLKITGTVERGTYVGGLAYYVMGTGATLNNVTVQKTFKKEVSGTVGGVFGEQMNGNNTVITTSNLTLLSVFEDPSSAISSFVPYLNNADVHMTDTVIGGSMVTTTGTAYGDVKITGGFLGMQWTEVDGIVDGLTVQSGTSYKAAYNFGALVTVATTKKGGRLTMKDVKLNGLTVTANGESSKQFRSSLMVWDAKKMILEVIDYDASGCTVTTTDNNFDEIAGETKAGSGAYTISGIVSVHKTDGNGNPVYYPDYHYEYSADYTNGPPQNGNNYSMYFYDVFQRLDDADGNPQKWITGTAERGILDSVEDVLLWDILHYATGGNVWETFKEYCTYYINADKKHSTSLIWDTLTLSGDLDLSKISFYPVPRIGCSLNAEPGTVITFDASPMASWELHNLGDNAGDRTQHYGLQGGLLYEPVELYVNGDGGELILKGKVANFKKFSGALVVGNNGAKVACSIKNVTLDGLAINNYSGQAAGLLISKVSGNTSAASYGNVIANFDNIKMINYDSYQSSGKKVAAALIGCVGGATVMDIRLNFRNMVIADETKGTTRPHNGNVLQYASFIYDYQYTDDAQINEGYGLYLFSQSDAQNGNVTYGKELDTETEFCDNENLVYQVMFDGVDNTDTDYIPYIYQYDKIEVNPKSGNILKGCGTYDDPYIIENAKQFLTLYRFINETGTAPSNYQYKTFYNNWKIIAPGDDSAICTTKHSVTLKSDGTLPETGAEDVKVFSESNDDFPTPEQLSRAYYQLGANIDLSVAMSTTYEIIADEFVGFGTEERPFVGVWDGNGHTITLPDKPKKITNTSATDYKEEAYENYGFIQFAKGTVVKDLTIKFAIDDSGKFEKTNAVRVKTSGGGVIGTILGGDNIIDNVTVAVGFNLLDITEDRLIYVDKADVTAPDVVVDDMAVGGYVGLVKKGGLIIRSMPANALANFYTDQQQSGSEKYELIGAVVGKVEDGYVLYEGSRDTANLVWQGKDGSVAGGHTYYPQIANYAILNGDALEAASTGLSISGTKDNSADTPVEITIPTAGALQVMSMALNSDALNIRPSDCPFYTTDEAGYTELSRSRKAAYSDIGCTTATDDYIKAAKYDNVMGYTQNGYTNADTAYAYPYLYQYMNIDGENYLNYLAEYHVTIADSNVTRQYSMLNPNMVGRHQLIYHVWWKLAENSTYDMTVVKDSFRGIGATYQVGPIDGDRGYGASFHANFDGNGSTVKIEMNRKLLGDDRSDGSSKTKTTDSLVSAGLFNVLYGKHINNNNQSDDRLLYLQEEDFCDRDGVAVLKDCMVIKDLTITGTISADPNNNVAKKRYHLGAVAGTTSGRLNLVLDNVKVQDYMGTGVGNKVEGGYNVGGLIGYVGNRAYILIRDCVVSDATIKGQQEGGGLVGKSDAYVLKMTGTTVEDTTVYAGVNTGGFLGWASKDNSQDGNGNADRKVIILGTVDKPNLVKNSTIGNNSGEYTSDCAGGFIGALERTFSVKYAKTENVTLNAWKDMGGIIGHATISNEKFFDYTSIISDVEIADLKTKEVELCTAETNGTGGVVGCNYHNLIIENAAVRGTSVDNFKMQAKWARTGHTGFGGVVGAQVKSGAHVLTMSNCTVDTVSVVIQVNNSFNMYVAAGGLIGFIEAPVVLSGTQSVSNSIIKAPLASESTHPVMAAGGCFGYVDGSKYSSEDAKAYGFIIKDANTSGAFKGLIVTNNTVTAKQAGGVAGYVTDVNTGIRLAELTVEGGFVTSDESAGGVYGYIAADNHGTVLDSGSKANTIKGVSVSGREAGGIIGTLQMHVNMRLQSVVLRDNVITATQETVGANYSAGGLIGKYIGEDSGGAAGTLAPLRMYDVKLYGNTIAAETAGDTLTEAEAANVAVGGAIGRVQDDSDGTMTENILYDNLVIDDTNKIGVRKTGNETTEVQLVKAETSEDTTTYTLSDLEEAEVADIAASVVTENADVTDYEVLDALEETYGHFVGNYVGVINSEKVQMYILRSNDGTANANDADDNKFVTPVLDVNPPVVDVGRTTAQSVDDYRQYCHIIYGAQNSIAQIGIPADGETETNLSDMATAVNAVSSAYVETDETDKLSALLQKYRLSPAAIETFENTYHETFTFADGMKLDFPIVVWQTEYGTLQTVMEHIVNVMTNVAGDSATDIEEDYLTLVVQKKVFDGTTISDGTGDASILVGTENGETTYEYVDFDGVTDEGVLTFSELTFTYGWKDHQKTFKLPVFIEEPILYNVHTKMIEGKVTDVDTIKANGLLDGKSDRVIMANDSDYTLLLEYSYGKARKNMPDNSYVDKVFYVTNSNKDKTITKGTRLMLVDASNGNKVYYYEVEEDNLTKLTFSMFKDSQGNSYQGTSINKIPDAGIADAEGDTHYTDLAGHDLTNTGVETFLLTVLAAESSATKNEYYDIHSGIEIEDESLKSRFYPMEDKTEASYTVLSIPGLAISFINKGDGTNIDGSISKESTVQVDGEIELRAKDQLYWEEKKKAAEGTPIIDSSNNGKYLDLAFYLRDTNGNRVRFPAGTNFSYFMNTDINGEAVYSDNKVIPNDSVVYYYKDIRSAFGIADSEYRISSLEKDTTVDVHFKLDFSGADLSNITDENYNAWLELLRTANKEYPMGNGNKLDSYSETVEASASQRLGFAIRANDLNELAVNTYPTPKDEDIINYRVIFDFSEVLKQAFGNGEDALTEKWANYDYDVTYQLYRKVLKDDVITYEKYTGNDIVLAADNAAGAVNTEKISNTPAVLGTNGTMTVKYNFTANMLSTNEGLLFFPCKVTINTDELTTADLTNLTNYKVEASLVVSQKKSDDVETGEEEGEESEDIIIQPAEETKDFFIYTITKLKTDI